MARKRMVTRTVTENLYTVKAVNPDTETFITLDVSISATLPEKKKLQVLYDTLRESNLTLVKILSTSTRETLYGLEESIFIKMATVLPPRSKVNPDTGLVEIDE